jgi:Ca2+-binding RTX toxin-like protein
MSFPIARALAVAALAAGAAGDELALRAPATRLEIDLGTGTDVLIGGLGDDVLTRGEIVFD